MMRRWQRLAKQDSDINRDLTAENSELNHRLIMQKRKTKTEKEKWEQLSIEKNDLQDLYDLKVEEMNLLCSSPGKLLMQLVKSIVEKFTSGPLDQK